MEVGYPSELEPLLLPYSDGMSDICGNAPTMYANVPAEVIMDVVCKHCGLRSDTAKLPDLLLVYEAAAAVVANAVAYEKEAERDENGHSWAAAAVPPSTEESGVTSDGQRSPYAMEHMGAPPPPPPPMNTPTQQVRPTTIPGELTPPQELKQVEISPIERKNEDYYKF